MKSRSRMLPLVFVLALVAGCASTNVTQSTPMAQPGLARPNRIWVYNFVANPADMPADSSITQPDQSVEHAADARSDRKRAAASAPLSRRTWWRTSTRWDLTPCRQATELRRKSATV